MTNQDLITRRRYLFLFKLLSGLIPLLLLLLVTYGISALVGDLLEVDRFSTLWWLLSVLFGIGLLIYYATGFFSGSLRLDGNILSLISRMDLAEQKALLEVLKEVTKEK